MTATTEDNGVILDSYQETTHHEAVDQRTQEKVYLSAVVPGSVVTYCDESGVHHAALVTTVHGKFGKYVREDFPNMDDDDWENGTLKGQFRPVPCINLVYVTPDAKKHDPYGNQIVRASSVQHSSATTARGRFWK